MKYLADLVGVDTPRTQDNVLRVASRHAICLLLDLTHFYSVAILLHLVQKHLPEHEHHFLLLFPVIGVEARNIEVVEYIGHFGVIVQSRLFLIFVNVVQRFVVILLVLPQAKDYFRAVCVIDFL